jgi:hypothetical protein
MFGSNIVYIFASALKIETVCFAKTLVSTYKSTRTYNPEYHHRKLHRRENLKHQASYVNADSEDFHSIRHGNKFAMIYHDAINCKESADNNVITDNQGNCHK